MTPEQLMSTRLAEIIEYKTQGNQAAFARLMGWSKQYLHNLLAGTTSVGLTPIISLATTLPEINTRWLLTGEGNMIDSASHIIRTWLTLEEYIPVMTTEERAKIEQGSGYTLSDINRWQSLLAARKQSINARFEAAFAHQK